MAVNQDYTALRERYQQRQAERQQARTSHTEALKNAFMQRQAQRGITNTQNSQSGAFDIDSRKMGFLQRQLQRGNITEEQVLEQVYKPYKDFINQVNGVISGYEQFANNYNTRFGGRKYDMSDAYMGDSQQYLDEVTAYNQQLIAQSNAILATLEANPDAFDKETAEEIKRAMTMAQENAAAILKVAGEDNTYWNSWGNGAIDHEQELEEMQLLLAEWDATGALRNSVEQGLPLNDEQQERYNRLVAAMEPYGGAREVLENAIAEKQKFLDENPDWRNATTAESMYLQAQQDQSYADKYNGVSGVKLLDVINFLDEGAEKEWVTGQALRTMAFDEAQAVVETMEQEFRELSQTGTLRNAYASGMALTPEEEAAAKAAIAQYESVLKKYGIDTKGEDAEPMEAFSKLIQQRKTLVAESKKTQEYVRLSAVQENKDFAKYVEKGKAEAIEYAEKNKKTDHMTNKEIDVLAYYIGKDKENGTNTADTYKAAIKHYLKHRRAQEIADNINGMDIPVIEGLTRIGYSYIADMVRFGRGIVQNFNFGDEAIGPTVFELGSNYAGAGKDLNWFDRTAHKVAGVMGYMTPALLTAKLTGGATGIASLGKAAGSALMFLGSAGEAYGEALDKGYDKPAARAYSALVGLSEVTLQNVLGGISEFGGLPAMLEGKIAAIKKVLLRTAAKYGVSIVGEEIEENLQNFLEPAIRTMVLGEEYDMPTMQEVFDTIITTALSTSGMEGPGIVKESIKDAKVDKLLGENINEHSFLTPRERVVVNTITDKLVAEAEQGGKKLSADEKQKIYDQVVDDMDTGRIDIQQIEEAFEKGAEYEQLVSEYEELKKLNKMNPMEMTGDQKNRWNELSEKNLEFGDKYGYGYRGYEKYIESYDKAFPKAVEGLVKSDRLAESYRERDRRSEAYKVENLDQYSEAQRQTIRDAMNSGILNNTRRTHEFVDFIAKVSDKLGVKFNFTDNKRLRESGFAMEGVTVNGFVNKDGITVNVNSAKALNSVVGHEITNILEGTDLYESLAMAITEYARKKGEYESRMQQIRDLYEGKEGYTGENAEAKLEAELVADLVGDYIFTDKQFVEKLFNEDRGLFNWIRKQINYLHSLATAGSKEARLLEKSKKMFAEVVNEAKQDVNRKSLADSDGDLFSLPNDKKRDATYIDAVNRGDKQAAKEMVDEYSISAPGQTKTTGGGWDVRGQDVGLPMPEGYQEGGTVAADGPVGLPESGFVGSYTGTTYTPKQASLLASVSLEGIQNATDLARKRDISFNDIGISDQQTKQAWVDAGLAYEETNPDGDVYFAVNDAMLMDERERRQKGSTIAQAAQKAGLPGLEKSQPQSQRKAQSGVLPMPKQTPKDQQTAAREALHEALSGKQQTGTRPAQQTTKQEVEDLDAEFRRQIGDDSSYYDPAEDVLFSVSAPVKKVTSGKQRKWVKTSTESEAVDRKILPEDLDQELIHYQPISNQKTLDTANSKLGALGYDAAVQYMNQQIYTDKVSLSDIALGERLIQEAVKRGDTKTAGDLIMDISILGTELGQKVQALSIIKRLTPEGQLKALTRVVSRGHLKGDKSFDGVEITQEMKDHILGAYNKDGSYDQKDLTQRVEDVKDQLAEQMQRTVGDYTRAWRYLAMLGNPKTHIRNLVSNAAMAVTRAQKNVLARTMEDLFVTENRTKTWKRATDDVKAFAQEAMNEYVAEKGKYNEGDDIKSRKDIFFTKGANWAAKKNSDLLAWEDNLFSKSVYRSTLQEYLTANGIKTKADIAKNGKLVAKAKAYAEAQAKEATFQQDSYIAKKISEIENRNAFNKVLFGAVMPFKTTPINIAKTAVQYSPLSFARSIYDFVQVGRGKMNASDAIDRLSKGITGTSLSLIGFALASMGVLNGAGEDDKEGQYDYQLGKQTYSVNIGGNTYSLNWLSPTAMPLFVGVNFYEQLVDDKEWNADVIFEALAQTLDPMSEMSFLSSLDDVLKSYESGAAKFMGIFQSAGKSYISQFFPTILSQLASTFDSKKRVTKASPDSGFKFGEGLWNQIKYKLPGLRNTLEPATDIWGNELTQSENFLGRALESFFAPYSRKENLTSDVDEELKDLYDEVGDNALLPNIPYGYFDYKGEKYKMSDEEYTQFKETYGQTAYDTLEQLMETRAYKNASADEKADMVKKVYDYAKDVARQEYLDGIGEEYTNATKNGRDYYKENPIAGAVANDMTPDEYSYSTNYPGKYAVSQAVGGYEKYQSYTSHINKISADKDANGKTVENSRKQKVVKYINNLDASYGEKIILYVSEYPTKENREKYGKDILEYLNGRKDISRKQRIQILEELGFKVSKDGKVSY